MMDLHRMFPRCSSFIFNVVWLNFLVQSYTCLRLTNMTAPTIQDPRKDMLLHCSFDMGGEELYAVKWYKDDHEFFRYSPSTSSSILQFPVPGVQVERQRTRCTEERCDLLLTNLSRPLSSGAYRCEVSTEAPAFRLASQTHNVTVAALPTELPQMEGLSDTYLLGSLLIANCTSGFGDPKPILTWYVNKEEVSPKLIRELPSKSTTTFPDERTKLRSTSSQIKLPLDKKLTANQPSANLEISCVSSNQGIKPAVAPPLTSRKNIVIIDQNQRINNEKLHWSDAASSIGMSKFLVILSTLTVLVKCC